ncbi:PREDICTED: probable ATP-dependent RNA helicase DDX46 [Priapulus caudatus]|uniref:RNA helicase n=1 Tax=Priapulus caudatus TaxID=37621 RepID=A0ABM1EDM7_PRICU|nr:PREDICTED: probable ATP-dependent RNA helicase DDX46 [Priapulus caudatus]
MVREGRQYRKKSRSRSSSPRRRDRDRSRKSRSKERDRELKKARSKSRERTRRSKSREKRSKSRNRDKPRSSSKDKDKQRSRSRDRDRDRDRRRRSKSHDRSRRRSHSRSRDGRKRSRTKSPGKKGKHQKSNDKDKVKSKDGSEEKQTEFQFDPLDKEAEQKRLETEMTRRRERIEHWRAERNKKKLEQARTNKDLPMPMFPGKKWSLEDEDEDEHEHVVVEPDAESGDQQENGTEPQEDVDPLDAYMQEVNNEVRTIMGHHHVAGKDAKMERVTRIVSVAKVKAEEKKKGELMQNDQDAMEYSSEEEEEDLKKKASALEASKSTAKKLEAVDHTKVTYQPFRKNFYVEVPEIARLSPEDVEVQRQELESIVVKGKGCPKPISQWAQCGVSKKILDSMKKQNYETPTPIQAQGIPAIMAGRDVIGIAKTGSGKTIAFLLPMFRHIMDQPPLETDDGPIALIMTPTRELAMQISRECKKFCRQLGVHPVCVYGGTGISEQIAELKRGAEIIVCTPGRMIDMLAANSGRVTNLKRVTYLVLDEADRMFDMGFEPQVMRIVENTRPDRQTVMFSATFPRPMEALARKVLNKPVEVQVGGRSIVAKEVDQKVLLIDEDDKFFKLLELLGVYQEKGSVLVFVDKQENADILLKDLMKASYPCLSLHGGIDQFDRDSTIIDFKNGNISLLVATSVAARGLDVKQLVLVVNYDCPNHYEDYVHRCGRTGRAGNKGSAYTFITPDQERYVGDILRALELSGAPMPDELMEMSSTYKDRMKSEGKKRGGGAGVFKVAVKCLFGAPMAKWTGNRTPDGDREEETAEGCSRPAGFRRGGRSRYRPAD